jgi:phenylalanyl-tRNA synthetase alpha subunit
MVRMHKLVTIYQEIQDSISYFLKLFRLGREKGVTPEQIIKLVQMADSIHKLQDKLQQLKSELIDVSRRKAVGQEVLEDFNKEIEAAQEKLDLVNKTFEVKYEELKEVCSQTQKLQNYVEQFKSSQDYRELESVVRNEVEKTLLDNKRLLQNALFSILLALRNQPDRYYIVDSMELTHFTTTIIKYDSYLASRRPPGSEQFIGGRMIEIAERIFGNLQKNMVDNTISTAAELEDGMSHATGYRALPY